MPKSAVTDAKFVQTASVSIILRHARDAKHVTAFALMTIQNAAVVNASTAHAYARREPVEMIAPLSH